AVVEHLSLKVTTILTAGDFTLRNLYKLMIAHKEFFATNDVDNTSKVKKILGGFVDDHIKMWINNDCDHIEGLSYEAFIDEILKNFLPRDWEVVTRNELCGRHMQVNEKFWAWVNEIKSLNFLLKGTSSHLDDIALRHHLETNMDKDLFCHCYREMIHGIKILKDWCESVRDADDHLCNVKKQNHKMLKDLTR
ncbi:hypothetical protein CPC08DRAFT_647961, partial [Agrocybe pediades]